MRLKVVVRPRRRNARRDGRRRFWTRAEKETERELLEGDVDDWKEDVFVAGGDGVVAPTLPLPGVAQELYEEFERDEARPRDVAP